MEKSLTYLTADLNDQANVDVLLKMAGLEDVRDEFGPGFVGRFSTYDEASRTVHFVQSGGRSVVAVSIVGATPKEAKRFVREMLKVKDLWSADVLKSAIERAVGLELGPKAARH